MDSGPVRNGEIVGGMLDGASVDALIPGLPTTAAEYMARLDAVD